MLRRRRQWAGGPRKSIGERFRAARRQAIPAEGHELDLEALVRLGRAIEAAVKSHEGAAAVSCRELLPLVKKHPVR